MCVCLGVGDSGLVVNRKGPLPNMETWNMVMMTKDCFSNLVKKINIRLSLFVCLPVSSPSSFYAPPFFYMETISLKLSPLLLAGDQG